MEKAYFLEQHGDVLIIHFTKDPTEEEGFAAIDEAAVASEGPLRIWDLSHGCSLSTPSLISLAKYGQKTWPGPSRVAYIASDPLTYGNLRLFIGHRGPINFEASVFKSEADALGWVHAPSEEADPDF